MSDLLSKYKLIAVLLTIIFVIPVLIIPQEIMLKISIENIYIKESEDHWKDEGGTLYFILSTYYVLFVLTNISPFLFFSFLSLFSGRDYKRAKKRTRSILKGDSASVGEFSHIFRDRKYPKVSIIIPCYNESNYISSTITNCFRQTYRGEIEIIVIDDGSKDNTWSIGRIFKTKGPDRKIVVFHKPNGGKASAITYGIKKATGAIIITTDGDSEMDPNAVEELVLSFRTYKDAGIVGGYVFIKNTHQGYLTRLQQLEYIITQHLIRLNQSGDGSVLIAPGPIFGIRADVARMFPPLNRTMVEDCDLTMNILSTGYTTRAARDAISYTNAPTRWRDWKSQRKRWIYGQFQAWRENRWHLKNNPWGVYTYISWVITTLSALLLIPTMILTIYLVSNWDELFNIFEFISVRTLIILLIYFGVRTSILVQYKESRGLIRYLPLKILYDLVNGFLTAYLYIRYITGIGVKVKWGNTNKVIH